MSSMNLLENQVPMVRTASSFRHNPYSTECTYTECTPYNEELTPRVSNWSFSSLPSEAYGDNVPRLLRVQTSDLKTARADSNGSMCPSSVQSHSTTPMDTPPPSPPAVTNLSQAVPPMLRRASHCSVPSPMASPQAAPKPVVGYELSVQFKYGRSNLYTHTQPVDVSVHVIVEGDRGLDLGVVVASRVLTEGMDTKAKANKVRRVATAKEVRTWKEGHVVDEAKAMKYITNQVARHNLPITVHKAEFQFDKKKITFHYSTEAEHPDFRVLLKEAYRQFRCRIWLNNCNPQGNSPGQALPLSHLN